MAISIVPLCWWETSIISNTMASGMIKDATILSSSFAWNRPSDGRSWCFYSNCDEREAFKCSVSLWFLWVFFCAPVVLMTVFTFKISYCSTVYNSEFSAEVQRALLWKLEFLALLQLILFLTIYTAPGNLRCTWTTYIYCFPFTYTLLTKREVNATQGICKVSRQVS